MNIKEALEITKGMDSVESIIERLVTASEESRELPCLGLATTRELLAELTARFEIQCVRGLDYKTYDPDMAP